MHKEAWYLENVKEKENRSWPDDDKLSVFYMCKNHPAAEVAQKFNATRIQIYNITRLARKALKQQCYHCGTPLTEEEATAPKTGLIKACNKCKAAFVEYKKERRDRALKIHMCGVCGTRPVLRGHKACKSCISSTYRRRIKEGLCGICGERPIKGDGSLCEHCLKV
jgi:transposase-like protein